MDNAYSVSGKNGFLSKQVRYTATYVGCVAVAVEHWFWVFVKMDYSKPAGKRVVESREVSYEDGLALLG